MKHRLLSRRTPVVLLAVLCIVALLVPLTVQAAPPAAPLAQGGAWWDVTPEPEVPSPQYDSILYSEIAPRLREIETTSNRVRVEVMGQSAGGRNLFLVTISAPEAMGRLGHYQALRQQMLKDPAKAQEMIDQFQDFKVPVFINGSIHGNEYPGTDAAMRLIETFAYGDTPEINWILENTILLINVVQNPDGRVLGTRANANGFDVNRDFITLSQPESRATVEVLKAWNPMVMLDLHGFVNPMLIEPCTPPHNPNYEYDLYIKWALAEAEAMEAEVEKLNEGLPTPQFDVQIPFRDGYFGDPEGWDDWPPIFAPMYSMYHGAYGHTLETPYRDVRGVDAHYAAVWGMLKFVAENRMQMINDQIEIFRRGFLSLPQMLIPQEILDQSDIDQFNDLTIMDFPAAYLIPKDAPLQQNPFAAAHLVDHLLFNDVQVEQASQPFMLDGVDYPAGTYVVWMNQPKRGLANTILWAGWDISDNPGLTMYDISGWSHPLLWGATRAVMDEAQDLKTHGITKSDPVQGSREGGKAGAFAYLPTSNTAIKATNDLLRRGETVYRSEASFVADGRTFGAGTFVLPAVQSTANELASQYGLQIYALKQRPGGLTTLRLPRIAHDVDAGTRFVLKDLGFDYTLVTPADINAGALASYDVYINDLRQWSNLNPAGKTNFLNFVNGGGDYIGIGRGIPLAQQAGLLTFTFNLGTSSDNGVVRTTYMPTDSVAAQYPMDSHAFVYRPYWFTSWGPNVQVSAAYGGGDFFVSGYWPGWDTSGAAGQPSVIHGPYGPAEITLLGISPTFRAHPEHTFRLLANALYNGLD